MRRLLGDPHVLDAIKLARRRQGLLVPDAAAHFEVGQRTARRFLARLVAAGWLHRPGERRRRVEVFEVVHGAGAFVYRPTRRARDVVLYPWRTADARWRARWTWPG